jgi:nicotinamide phosphoribosyltransferase
MYDYMEARSNKTYPATVFVGLQGFLKTYLTDPITIDEVNQAYEFSKGHGIPFDLEGWEYIVGTLGGKLPVEIKAIDEGTLVPTKMVLMTIESTDEKVPWVAGWLETMLMRLWYPCGVSTKSYYTRKMLEKYGSKEWARFAYHNFGSRGSTTTEASQIGGFAHSTQFMGTDNFDSLLYSFENYGSQMSAYSVFATEHSTVTSWGKDKEMDFVYQMLLDNPDAPIMSFVADSYDVYKFTNEVTKAGSKIRELIESRPNQKFVLRPDSGEPIEVLSKMITIMKDNGVFDSDIDGKLLSTNFGILWGDGITPEVIEDILKTFTTYEYIPAPDQTSVSLLAAENFVFGSGGDLMQNHTRDTMGFAVKCSSITVDEGYPIETGKVFDNGVPEMVWEPAYKDIDVFKDPITDSGKKSKKGKVATYYNAQTNDYIVGNVENKYPGYVTALNTVYKNGEIIKETTLDEIRSKTA